MGHTMNTSTLTLKRAWLAAACLIALSGAAAVQAADSAPRPLPAGWQPLALPTLSGNFRKQGDKDTAVLVQNGQDGPYGLAVVPEADGGQASIVKTFRDIKANPPQLSLVKPGSYKPVCHDGGDCAPLSIANEAIGLCFGEASCQIIYFNGSAFREISVTD